LLRARHTLALALAGAALLAGCGSKDKPQDVVTALEDYTNVTPAALQRAIRNVRESANEQTADLVSSSGSLRRDVDAGNLRAARADYELARQAYARLEALAPLFPALARAIGDRELRPLAGDLHTRQRIDAGTRRAAAGLARDARALRERLRTAEIPPRKAIDGAAAVVDRSAREGVSGRLEPDSKLDLTVLLANLDGAEGIFLAVEDFVKAKNRRLAGKTIDGFDDTNTDVLELRRDGRLPDFDAVTPAQRREIQDDLDKLEYAFDQVPDVLAKGL
jgi:iron uptake system component EfeO